MCHARIAAYAFNSLQPRTGRSAPTRQDFIENQKRINIELYGDAAAWKMCLSLDCRCACQPTVARCFAAATRAFTALLLQRSFDQFAFALSIVVLSAFVAFLW